MEQLVPTAGGQIVVCQCHRSCWTWRWPSRRASTGAVPVKVADLPVASMTGAWGCQCRNCGVRSCSTDTGFDVPVVQVVVGFLGAFCEVGEVGGRSSSHR